MTKPSTAPVLSIKARDDGWSEIRNEPQPDWADAETRGFLERPVSPTPFAKVLGVMLITAMVVAVVKVAWILAVHVR
jgi:hypothetical protein